MKVLMIDVAENKAIRKYRFIFEVTDNVLINSIIQRKTSFQNFWCTICFDGIASCPFEDQLGCFVVPYYLAFERGYNRRSPIK